MTLNYSASAAGAAAAMPAITLSLAEIEERLRLLRRRLNAVVVQRGVYVSCSVLVLMAAGLVLLALRGSAPAFRIAVWAAAAVSLCVVAGCVVFLQRRWLDPQATAHLVDRRAQLTDRLATIVSLRTRPQSRLAPMLIAQALGMGGRWQIQEIVPRRVPYSVFALVASILVLVLTAFTAPHPPVSGSPATAVDGISESVAVSTGHRPHFPGEDGPPAGDSAAGGAALRPSTDTGTTAAPSGAVSNSSIDADTLRADGAPATLTDRLQAAIRHVFDAEVMDKPRALGEGADKGTEASGEGTQGNGAPKRQPETSGSGKPMSRNGAAPQASGRDRRNSSGQSQPNERGGERQDLAAPSGNFKGSSPAAGDGSSPGNLMSAQAASVTLGSDGPKTFKITLTSFLRAAEQPGTQPRASQEPAGTRDAADPVGSARAALSDRQLNDDALRKVEIPPEYEDIVRRVYSVRGQ